MKASTRLKRSGAVYRAAARAFRRFADALEQRAEPTTAQQRRALTLAVHGASWYARGLCRRHARLDLDRRMCGIGKGK